MNRPIHLADTNVLIGLTDPMSRFHQLAHAWLARQQDAGWATCPITENGFVRITTNPSYASGQLSFPTAVQLLRSLKNLSGYRFISDDYSLFEPDGEDFNISGHNQVTDLYLLELAKRHGMKLATFDHRTKFLPKAYQPFLELL